MVTNSLSSADEALPAIDTQVPGEAPLWLIISAFWVITKPRIMFLLLFTTLAALLIAAREHPLPAATLVRLLLATMVGGALASGGASALNCYIDRDIDVVMKRTRRRPLPAGILTPRQVLLYGLGLSALSLIVLVPFTNVLAGLLALLGNFFYVVVYTLWLKRATTQNIVIGGIAGAIPPLVGWAAVTDSIALPAILLVVIITYWTPAHFWSLAILNQRDYTRAHIPMLPSATSEKHAAWQILMYTLLVVIATLMLFTTHVMGSVYLVAAIVLDGLFIVRAVRLLRDQSSKTARDTFMFSNYYLAALFAAMVVDRVIHF